MLAQAAVAGAPRVINGLSESHELRIATQSGVSRPAALLSIPLIHSGKTIAVIGLASLCDYREEDLTFARTLTVSLGQSIAAAQSNEKTCV